MRRALFLILGVVLIAAVAGYFIYNKPFKNINKAKPDFELTSQALFAEFENDEESANQKFLDKVIQVQGQVVASETDADGLTTVSLQGGGMMFGIICKLDPLSTHKRTQFEPGEAVTLKGICAGMLMDVILDRCVEL